MASFGERLRAEREAQGLTLDEISARTRLGYRLLAAIEADRFDELPGGVYNVSFVRQYAHCVGLDEDRIADEFKKLTAPIASIYPRSHEDIRSDGVAKEAGVTLAEKVTEYSHRYRSVAPMLVVLLIVVVAVAAVLFSQDDERLPGTVTEVAGGARVQPVVEQAETEPREGTELAGQRSGIVPPAETPEQNGRSAGQGAGEPQESRASKPVQVEINVRDTVWIQARADGQYVFADLFRPGQTKSIEANDSVRLLVGNAGGIRLALNGEQMPEIGPPGQVQRILLTPSGMKLLPPPKKPSDAGGSGGGSLETGRVHPRRSEAVPALAHGQPSGRL